MPTVTVKEVFDLHTTPSKITLIGIHTPNNKLLALTYPHLHLACKKMRFASCNVAIACASVLPVDPLQVGTESGDVAPEDLFNPILYRAVTKESFNALDSRLFNASFQSGVDVDGDTAGVDVDSVVPDSVDQFGLYYGLLADHHGFRTASPQQGLTMSDLRPLVYETYDDIGYVGRDASGNSDPSYPVITSAGTLNYNSARHFRGAAHPMPALDTLAPVSTNDGDSGTLKEGDIPVHSDDGGGIATCLTRIPKYPTIYVGAIVMPPARLHQFFYRMVVSWTIEYSGLRTSSDLTSLGMTSAIGSHVHKAQSGVVPAKAKAVAFPGIEAESDPPNNETATVDMDTVSTSPSANISKVI